MPTPRCVLLVSLAAALTRSSQGVDLLQQYPTPLTLDMDTKSGLRRFFVVDKEAETARYIDAFENRAVKPPPPITPGLAAEVFDELWKAFDRDYAMFVLRPEVDWGRLPEQFRPRVGQPLRL
jgi:hypothetical protein